MAKATYICDVGRPRDLTAEQMVEPCKCRHPRADHWFGGGSCGECDGCDYFRPRKGDMSTVKTGTCVLDDCSRPAFARGWCSLHYARWRKHGTTELPPLGQRPTKARGKLRASGRPIAAGYRHNETAPAGIEPGYRASRCRCLGPRPRQQCWLDLTGPDGVCDACRETCKPAWRANTAAGGAT